MNLLEYEGKKLFRRYRITTPRSQLLAPGQTTVRLARPLVLKSQVPVGHRARRGGVITITQSRQLKPAIQKLWQTAIAGHRPSRILAEEKIIGYERYVSFSYSPATRRPVLSLSARGGTSLRQAITQDIDPGLGLPDFVIRQALIASHLPPRSPLSPIIQSLWQLFIQEKALLAEINPLFETADGRVVAGDAKVILDDHVVQPQYRPYVTLSGDIAVLASGGGASLLNLDALLRAGGRPANYVEYSGNPRSSIVAQLTKKVLQPPHLKGCWVIGGTANFTDIYETLSGFVTGLLTIRPRPRYPIVIRRDGPRRAEAFIMLKQIGKKHGFNFHLFGPETPMAASARYLVRLAYRS